MGTISAILGNSGQHIKTRLEKDQHRARFCLPTRTNKIDKKLSQKQPKMLPKWSLERSRKVPRPPQELQSALLESPKTHQELQRHPRGLQSRPEGSPRDLQDAIGTSKWRPGDAFGPQNGGRGVHLDLKMETWGAFLRTKDKP